MKLKEGSAASEQESEWVTTKPGLLTGLWTGLQHCPKLVPAPQLKFPADYCDKLFVCFCMGCVAGVSTDCCVCAVCDVLLV